MTVVEYLFVVYFAKDSIYAPHISNTDRKVHPSVLTRRRWKKFGDSAQLPPGPDPNSTSYAEAVFLKLSIALQDSIKEEESLKKSTVQTVSILCRICQGNHFTNKCPYKDTHQPLDVIQSTVDSVKESVAETSGRYVPPSMRNRGPGDAMPSRRDEFPTIRVTNLSEDATESDVRALVSRFGHPTRVFVARDKELNVCKGFAFISYATREAGQKVIDALNGFGYDSLILKVEWSNKE